MELYAKRCSCGAITVHADKENWSMTIEDFIIKFPDLKLEKEEYGNCNYCVNHWGIDLCGCGSGEKVGECEGEFNECINHIPAQTLWKPKKYTLWK